MTGAPARHNARYKQRTEYIEWLRQSINAWVIFQLLSVSLFDVRKAMKVIRYFLPEPLMEGARWRVIDGYDGLSQAVSLFIYHLLRYAGEGAVSV